MIDERRRHAMITSFIDTNGEDAAMALAESLFSIDHATKAELRPLATKADLAAYATKDDLRDALVPYATKVDLAAHPTKDDLKDALKPYATRDEIDRKLAQALRDQGRWYLGITGLMISISTGLLMYVG